MNLPRDPRELAAYIQRLQQRLEPRAPWESLEELFTAPDLFGVPASPLQRALCRIADGRPLGDIADHPDVVAALRGGTPPEGAPCELAILAGIRGGKSLLAAALAVHCSQRVDVSRLSPGDMPRFASVSLTKDLAGAVFDHLEGNVMARPALRALVLEEPTAGRIVLRHPSGRPIEVVVSAGRRAGGSLVARWLAGVVFDEFAMMASEGEAVINWDEQRKAVRNRILPGGIIVHIGSPWAPFGPAFQMVRDHHGKPTRDLVVVKAPGPAMNPTWWTPERVAEARRADPDAAQMTIDAEFGTPPEAMFGNADLLKCTRSEPEELEPDDRLEYTAAIDPATRGNGWTLVVTTRIGGRRIVVLAREWRGSRAEPLDPEKTLKDIAEVLKPYRVKYVYTDQWAADPLRALGRKVSKGAGHEIVLVQQTVTPEEQFERYKAFQARLEAGDIELPAVPLLQADLRRVQKRVTSRGFTIHLPLTSDGRHCDFAPATMLALHRYLHDLREPPPHPDSPEAVRALAEKVRKEALTKRLQGNGQKPYWKRNVVGRKYS